MNKHSLLANRSNLNQQFGDGLLSFSVDDEDHHNVTRTNLFRQSHSEYEEEEDEQITADDDEFDDPIMYTAPLRDQKGKLSSIRRLIENGKEDGHQMQSSQDNEVEEEDISDTVEIDDMDRDAL
eukprot:CAMPEP_0197046838 /NCGR_PEP_ID=MMETSP1384-20130603/22451_1 /TAXON_ID=29189 /ORGANISM="Ammonia sp." /LENGTH=123 /DNA_ID=CAMNT_0042478679 /DNA_START=661 /DNA_END=1032 /DNA_ORIENTATION=+